MKIRHSQTRLSPLAVSIALAAACARVQAVDDVNLGTLFTLSNTSTVPNAAWSWFEDERAIIDRSNPLDPKLIVSSVSTGGAGESGDIDILWRNLSSGAQGEFELFNQLQTDDHNSASLYIRPDGRYLAMYGKHTSDALTHYRISTNPNDPSSWGADQTINNGASATYNNTYYLANDRGGLGRLYNFTRTVGWDPNVQTSTDQGTTWTLAGRVLAEGGDSDRPYVRYAGDGKSKIHLITTERHPRDYQNSIYYGYVSDGAMYQSGGAVVDANVFDSTAQAPSSLTKIFTNGSVWNGTPMHRAWTISMELDKSKNPVAIFSARANDSDQDHRFFYARYDGAEWKISQMARAGSYLYAAENDYTGLASIDPDNPNVVYMSSKYDPRDGSGATTTSKYELYKGTTSDFGATWTWSPITENSTIDNVRPLVPQWDGANTALVWMRGNYNSYTNWDTEAVGIKFLDSGPRASVWRGDAAVNNRWDNGTTANWDAGGGISNTFASGDEVTFDDSATTTSVNILTTVTPMNTAFNNTTKNYTITGSGIGGNGGLRILGGGTVTLSNSANTYTGETRIINGKLAITGTTSLSSTSKITIDPQGTLDVVAMSSNAYLLSNKSVTIDGKVIGNLVATNNSSIAANSLNAIQGNVSLSNSSIAGKGSVTGSLTAFGPSVLRVGAAGLGTTTINSLVTYTDANAANTRAYDQTTYPGNAWKIDVPSGTGTVDNLWDNRLSLANDGNIISANNTTAENAPLIQTTISGLAPGQNYEVYSYFWNASGVNWQMRATTDAANIQTNGTGTLSDDNLPANLVVNFSATGGAGANNAPAVATGFEGADNLGVATFGSGTLYSGSTQGYFSSDVKVAESNRYLLQASLGTMIADANGEIIVYVDDNASGTANARTWFDGIGVRTSQTIVTPGVNDFAIGGNATINIGVTLDLDVHSATAHDRLIVGGNATLSGTLLLNSASIPTLAGEQIEILTYASRSGRFGTITDSTNRFSIFYDNARAVAIADNWNNPASLDGDLDVPASFTVTGNAPWSGTHGKYGAGIVEYNGYQTFASSTVINLYAGTTRFNLDHADSVSIGTGVNVTINSGATLSLEGSKSALGTAAGNRVAMVNDGTLSSSTTENYVASIAGSGTTSILSGTMNVSNGLVQNALNVSNNAKLEIALNSATSKVSALNLNTSGTIQLHNSDLAIDYNGSSSPYAAVVDYVKSGLVLLGGNGTGIASSEVDNQTVAGTMLAVVDNAIVDGAITTLSGFTDFSADSVLVKYTWFGDSNLDGAVDGSDYALIDTGFTSGGALTGWVFGDYDYNGLVDGSDYALIDTGFLSQSGVLPEPASLSLLGLSAFALLRRRHRKETNHQEAQHFEQKNKKTSAVYP